MTRWGLALVVVGVVSFLIGSPVGPQFYPATWLGILLFLVGVVCAVLGSARRPVRDTNPSFLANSTTCLLAPLLSATSRSL